MSYNALLWYPEAYPQGQMFYGDSGYAGKDTFPLQKGDKDPMPKKGSEGNIGDLQRGLNKLGANLVDDGIFGSGTEKALAAKGYPKIVTRETFNKIMVAGGGVPAAGGGKGQQTKDTVKNILGGIADFWKEKKAAAEGAGADAGDDAGRADTGSGSSTGKTLAIVGGVLIFLTLIIFLIVYLRKPKAA